jgi:hypothetical protein
MLDIKGAFRVTKPAFVDDYFTVLLLNDALLFIRTGGETPDKIYSNPIEESDLSRYSGMSREEILGLHKKNFLLSYYEIISLDLKKSSLGLTRSDAYPDQGFSGAGTAPGITAENQKYADLPRAVKSASYLLFIIAGFSVINFIVFLAGSDINFVVGLAITQFIAAVASIIGSSTATLLAVIASLVFAAIFLVLGIFGRRGKTWAFVAGIVVYAADTILFFFVQDWQSIIFHLVILFLLIMGARACFKMNRSSADRVESGL